MICNARKSISGNFEQRVTDELLNGHMRLMDLPQSYRIAHRGVYITAFRADRGMSVARYDEDLDVLQRDISSLDLTSRNLKDLFRSMDDIGTFLKARQ